MKQIMVLVLLFYACGVKAAIPNFAYVGNDIYRSGLLDETNIDELLPYGFKSILSLKTNQIEVAVERKWALEHKVNFVNIPIQMWLYTESTKDQFREANFRTVMLPKPLLIHCTRGSERTGITVAMYRIIFQHWPVEKAIAEMDYYGFSPLFWYWKSFLEEI